MAKTFLCKVFRDEEYIGLYSPKSVLSKFGYSQDINTAGIQVEIKLDAGFDEVGAELETAFLLQDDGGHILTDLGGRLLISKDYIFSEVPIDLANRVEVWLYSDEYPNGLRVFDGLITSWRTKYIEKTTTIKTLSWGVKLDHELVQILPSSALISNELQDGSQRLFTEWKTDLGRVTAAAQTITTVGAAEVNSVQIAIANDGATGVQVEMKIINGTPTNPGSTLATVSRTISPQDMQLTDFVLSTAIELAASSTYFIQIANKNFSSGESATILVGTDSTSAYGSGAFYISNDSTGWSTPGLDMSFNVLSSSGAVGNAFVDQDPSQIIRTLLDTFTALGGRTTYDEDSIQDTGVIVSYTFKFNTIYEAIQKAVELAPANWGWHVDPGTNLLHFYDKGRTADHIMELGIHIHDLELERTIEGIKNTIYFSGGDSGSGENILVTETNEASRRKYGNWLDRPSDNRVTTEETARIMAQSHVNQNSPPRFRTQLTIPSEVYNIESFEIGQMIGFANFNNFIDSLLLQIVGKDYNPDSITLMLDTLRPTADKRVDELKRDLEKLQTIDNPDTL